jgi:sugar lactone lactonase YvrE
MPCFVQQHLYVTSLREGRSDEVLQQHPMMGGLFRTAAPVLGSPVGVFADA